MELYKDIPRICTAFAEWGACITYLCLIKKENIRSLLFWFTSVVVLLVQIVFLVFTGGLPTVFWIPCMLVALVIMYGYLMLGGNLSVLAAGYCCARAFLLAEFTASLEWQIFSFFQASGYGSQWLQIGLVFLVYGICFISMARLERSFMTRNYLNQLTLKEVLAAFLIVAAIFAFSNLSFIYNDLPFTSSLRAEIFSIRTLVDFGGIAILYAYQSRVCEYIAENELSVMNSLLKSQYDQYRNYQDSLDLIQTMHHDLKHQMIAFRAETNEERREDWLDVMEEEVNAFEMLNETGNQVLDTILAAKIFHCRKNKIQITCVADGKLLNFLHVTDICSIFGNALDNAIEHAILLPEEKRLIHLLVTAKKNFVFIKVENYCEEKIIKNERQLITTTKVDKQNHGFGLRSICMAAGKYGGNVDFGQENNWFELRILFPRG